MTAHDTNRWYVLRTLSGKEQAAEQELAAFCADVWRPAFKTLTKPTKKRKPVEVERPLTPGYVFARLALTDWPAVTDCRHVIGWIVEGNGYPAAIHEKRVAEMEGMRNRQELGIFDDNMIEGRFGIGDPIEVLFGPFSGQRVLFKAISGMFLEGEIELMGAKRVVKVPHTHVRLAKSAKV